MIKQASRRPFVLESIYHYLPLTQIWIHHLLSNFQQYQPVVLTSQLSNLDCFPLPYIQTRNRHAFDLFSTKFGRLFNHRLLESGTIKTLRFFQPLLVHSHFGDQGWKDINLVSTYNLPHLVSFYGYDASELPRNPKWKARFKNLFNSANLFLVEGPQMGQRLINLGCPENKITIHHLGINLGQYPFKERGARPDQPTKLLFAGRFREKKGLLIGIRALGKLKDQFNFTLTIVGDSAGDKEGGKIKLKARQLVKELQLENRVNFLGFQPHQVLKDLLLQHDLLLVPSLTAKSGDAEGGAPIVILDAAATGMVVVGTKHADIPEEVIDGQTGYLAEENNIDDFTQTLKMAFSRSEEWPEMSRWARRHVNQNFNAVTQTGKLEEIYGDVIKFSQPGH